MRDAGEARDGESPVVLDAERISEEFEDDEKEAPDAACQASHFKEKDEVVDLLKQLIAEHHPAEQDSIIEKIRKILDFYQEQSQLLGPYVVELMAPSNRYFEKLLELSVIPPQVRLYYPI